jgi:hypothetical protein
MFDVPYDWGVKIIGSQFRPKFVHDPKRHWHHKTNQIRPSDKLVSFANGKQFMTVSMMGSKFVGRMRKEPTSTPKRLLENYTAEVAALTIYWFLGPTIKYSIGCQ